MAFSMYVVQCRKCSVATGNRISGQVLQPYMIANLDPFAIDRAARLHRSAAGNGESHSVRGVRAFCICCLANVAMFSFSSCSLLMLYMYVLSFELKIVNLTFASFFV